MIRSRIKIKIPCVLIGFVTFYRIFPFTDLIIHLVVVKSESLKLAFRFCLCNVTVLESRLNPVDDSGTHLTSGLVLLGGAVVHFAVAACPVLIHFLVPAVLLCGFNIHAAKVGKPFVVNSFRFRFCTAPERYPFRESR